MTDEDGNIEEQIRHAPYGQVRARFSGSGAPRLPPSGDSVRYDFTGHETELNSGPTQAVPSLRRLNRSSNLQSVATNAREVEESGRITGTALTPAASIER